MGRGDRCLTARKNRNHLMTIHHLSNQSIWAHLIHMNHVTCGRADWAGQKVWVGLVRRGAEFGGCSLDLNWKSCDINQSIRHDLFHCRHGARLFNQSSPDSRTVGCPGPNPYPCPKPDTDSASCPAPGQSVGLESCWNLSPCVRHTCVQL